MTDYSKIEIVQNILTETLSKMGFGNAKISYEESITKGLVFNINCGTDSYLLIGRQGAHLHALQILVGQAAERKLKEPFWFTLDVDAAALEPMPNFERRFIHAFVQENFPEAESQSIDRDPYRKVVIRLKR